MFHDILINETDQSQKTTARLRRHQQQGVQSQQKDPYGQIEPLHNFDWRTTEPLQFRPFKPVYHLSMSLENPHVSELIEMDKHYLDRIMLRRQLIRDHEDKVIAVCDGVKQAIDELYSWLATIYLPIRFPTMFQITTNGSTGQAALFNKVISEISPLCPEPTADATLRRLGGLVKDDILFLQPTEDGDGYKLKAFVACFPNGFNPREKLDMKLRRIHESVPKYKDKLEKSMERWFDGLEVGRVVKRCNAISTHDRLYAPADHRPREGDSVQAKSVDIDMVWT
ncbi:uncharacterized protein Z518_02845 [Rhinocladiella mackenziei CBS 650.93]|uniref:Uncharacterized protein n=1 Tax=Rhinocladiella mackenziei CBS 650.93 TaxID=1442369 RepID=A0A0D2IQH2_9EURO|nr:uncharacterized protein Z518_02845 [Rhinocladiella mackenziei CBS 650.93]KIX08189.1 hypothetical protein Z518_02845 [Rhinocladiella mackenziei CBS 650.93]